MGEVIVLGMITQLKEVSKMGRTTVDEFVCLDIYFYLCFLFLFKGKFYLEDPSGTVQLDMSKAISFNMFTGVKNKLYIVQ